MCCLINGISNQCQRIQACYTRNDQSIKTAFLLAGVALVFLGAGSGAISLAYHRNIFLISSVASGSLGALLTAISCSIEDRN